MPKTLNKPIWGYIPNQFRKVFVSPFEQYANRIGQPFEVLGHDLQSEQELDEFEEMYKVRFLDGEVITAWGMEVCVPSAQYPDPSGFPN